LKLIVQLSGKHLYTTFVDCIPAIGSIVRIKAVTYFKGHYPGTIITFPVTHDDPPQFDFTETPPIAYLTANAFTVIVEGERTDEDDDGDEDEGTE